MSKDVKRALMIAEENRIARGRAMGFDMDTPLYHGTSKDIQAFEPRRASRWESMALKGTHLADNPEFANQYAQGKGANVMPVRARGKFLDAGKLVYEGSPEHEILNQLVKRRPNLRVFWDKDHEGKRVAPPLVSYLDAVPPAAVERIVKAAGYDGVRYPARYGDPSGRVSARTNAMVVFDPKNIRSQFAQFDPEQSESSDITKARGGSADKGIRRALMIARATGGKAEEAQGEWMSYGTTSPWSKAYREFPFVRNPTPDDIHRLMDMEGANTVRAIRDRDTNESYAFPGSLLHDQAITLTRLGSHDIARRRGWADIERAHIHRDKGKLSATPDKIEHYLRRASGGPIPPFKLKSGAADLIEQKGQKKALPAQFAAMPGIKPDEIKHSGFADLPAKAIPREEAAKHLREHTVPIEETTYAGNDPKSAKARYGRDGSLELPDGKNYREVVLRLPLAMQTPPFRHEQHWPDIDNPVAHIRMSDRKGPNGEKVLHVEEVQSDWGQQGREKGFKNPLTPAEREELRKFTDPPDEATARANFEPRNQQRWQELERRDNESDQKIVPGPYVDNTQKWTDLALKRVLHEAAHGGYDKVVVTPGNEQNKRYSLAKHATALEHSKNPNGTYRVDAHLPDGDNHLLGDELSEQELSAQVGKEIAQKIVRGEGETHPSLNGKVLRGFDLEVGGSGMRGYYDNTLPKRLQALAQQHDPKAKVHLNGHALAPAEFKPDYYAASDYAADYGRDERDREQLVEQHVNDQFRDYQKTAKDTPLHSLDVTPQMRDSIKQNGFNQFKRGGEVDDPIANWHWRPLEDVRNELQLDEIPSHVHKFGEFMDETARRATTHGLTPRDLIKAYAITRASIGRRALPAETLREAFTELPPDVTGRVRPEGAMGHWLHTKMGQRYLDEAEAGRVDEEAIEHARNAMRRFGKDQTEPMALRWAALNLPGKESRVSELIARAHRGQSAPEEWRGEMRMPGIAESKAGFLASMLGRGDQPTLDARQLILHTGRPTKEAAPILSRKGASEAAVNRLAGRQSELKLKHDPEMSPFYQHLAHHTIWDKAAGEETTHEDLMRALRGAKRGGRQTEKPLSLIASHPVVQGMAAALPAEAELKALLRKAGIVRPYEQPNKENIEKALKIARTYAMPLGAGASTSELDPSAYYNVAQPVAARDVTTKTLATKGYSLKPENPMSWSDFASIGKGGHVLNLSGDRTRFGTLHEINGKKLNWPVKVFAGPDYIREPVKGRAWASGSGVVSGLNSLVRELSKKGPVFGMYSPYGGTGGDFAHHMFDAVMAQVNPDDLTKGAKNKFDVAMRNGHFIMGGTDKIAKIRDRVKQKMGDWPGIDNPKKASEFARTKLTGDERKAILEYLDKKMWTDEGFPHVGITRVAVTDPKLLGVPQNVIGGNVALLKPSEKLPSSQHPSFPAGMAGEYVGTVPFSPRHYALPVSTAHFAKTPSAGKGIHVDPYSLDPMARAGYRTLFERNYVPEPVSQQMVEGAEEGIKKMPLYGLKTGGNVIARALKIARKTNGR